MLKQKNQRALASQSSQASPSHSLSMCCFAEKNYSSVWEWECVRVCVFTNQYYTIVGAYIVASKDTQSTTTQQSVNRGGVWRDVCRNIIDRKSPFLNRRFSITPLCLLSCASGYTSPHPHQMLTGGGWSATCTTHTHMHIVE